MGHIDLNETRLNTTFPFDYSSRIAYSLLSKDGYRISPSRLILREPVLVLGDLPRFP